MAESGRKSSRILILVSGLPHAHWWRSTLGRLWVRALTATRSTEVRQLNAPAELQKKRAILSQAHGSSQNGLHPAW